MNIVVIDLKADANEDGCLKHELHVRESCITMTPQDFEAFTQALNVPFRPNAALQNAMNAACQVKRD